MLATLLATPVEHGGWKLPAWLTPDPERAGDMLLRLALTLLAAWIMQQLSFLFIRRA